MKNPRNKFNKTVAWGSYFVDIDGFLIPIVLSEGFLGTELNWYVAQLVRGKVVPNRPRISRQQAKNTSGEDVVELILKAFLPSDLRRCLATLPGAPPEELVAYSGLDDFDVVATDSGFERIR